MRNTELSSIPRSKQITRSDYRQEQNQSIENYQQNCNILTAKNNYLRAQHEQNSQQLKIERQKNNKLQNQWKSIQSKVNQLKKERDDIETDISQKNKKLQTLQFNIKKERSKSKEPQGLSSEQFEKQRSQMQMSATQLRNQIQNCKRNKEQIQREMQFLSLQIQKKSGMMQTLINSIAQTEQKLSVLTPKIQLMKQTIRTLQENEGELDKILIRTQNQLNQSQSESGRLGQLLQVSKQSYMRERQVIEAQSLRNKFQKGPSVFMGDVLEGEEDYKVFAIDMIEKRMGGKKIIGTRLIYRYDTLNRVNFHKYIDNHDQLVVLIKLENGNVLGAWCEGSFSPQMNSDKDGIIFSFTNRKIFQLLQKNRRAISYDDYFLIIGNSEIRLKTQDNKVFSNFAISNGYYNARGEKVDILLGSGLTREVNLQTFEVFQLKLK